MKTTVAACLAIAIFMSSASAQTMNCETSSGVTTCYGGGTRPNFSDSFNRAYLGGQNLAAQYAMVNAYREAHGLPRCHWGWVGALKSAADGRPMC